MYRKSLESLREQLLSFNTVEPKKEKSPSFIQARVETEPLKEAKLPVYAEWLASISRAAKDVKETYRDQALSGVGGFAKGFSEGMSREEAIKKDPALNVPEQNRELFIKRRSGGPSYYSPKDSEAASFKELIDKHEGGGSYDTLFQFSDKPGGAFSNVRVSEMTLGEVKNFATSRGEGSYYQWAKENMPKDLIAYKKGLGSTPMGRYQFIGTTLIEVARDMGLSDDTVFSPEVQDAMFEHYLATTISKGKTLEDKVARVRSAWEGFNNVDRKTLETLIIKYEK